MNAELARNAGQVIRRLFRAIVKALLGGGKLIAFGNGGSAADAQHMVAELVGRYRAERKAIAAVALTVNSSSITSIANDYGFAKIFARQLEAIASPEDIVLAISTSGEYLQHFACSGNGEATAGTLNRSNRKHQSWRHASPSEPLHQRTL